MNYQEAYFDSLDGLKLYYRHYTGPEKAIPVICLSGLTRNSGDFDELATRYCHSRSFYCLDYRGRGKSSHDKNYQNYNPQIYLQDILTFMAAANIQQAIFIGTSLGGLLTMGMAGIALDKIAGAVLNDVGPEIASEGGSRIAGYVGQDARFPTLEAAAASQRETYGHVYPGLSDEEWLSMTAVSFILDDVTGEYKLNYDLNLGKALAEQIAAGESFDLWPFFEALKAKPTMAIRGALSDVLSKDVFETMQKLHPDMIAITLENRGHVPNLNEPPVLEALSRFLNEFD
ncbi:MAG: alpha/beta hydrolase [Sneathiella sp.]|nr:alpha/beta hydrolase [Sneathiella sp.]